MRRLRLVCELALRDWAHERLLAACGVVSLAGMLAPLLVLAGVHNGVINALRERLLEDPAILTVTPVGSGAYTPAWLAHVTQRPEVRFGILRTRDIAATVQLERQAAAGQDSPGGPQFVRVSLEPTAPGDPLLERAGVNPEGGDSVVLSASAARKLAGVQEGDFLVGRLGRLRPDGGPESVALPLRVQAVLPEEAEDRDVAFASSELLEDAENYRDYIAVPGRGFTGDPARGERTFAGFRLYARSLEDVAAVRDFLAAQGVETYTRAREVSFVSELDTSLTIIFTLIALTAGAGFTASTAGNVLAAVRRKHRQLGMIRLIGLSGAAITVYPLMQAVLTGLLGTLSAGLMYLALSAGIDGLFADKLYGTSICRLPPTRFAGILAVVVVLCALASARASVRAARIEPSEAIREL